MRGLVIGELELELELVGLIVNRRPLPLIERSCSVLDFSSSPAIFLTSTDSSLSAKTSMASKSSYRRIKLLFSSLESQMLRTIRSKFSRVTTFGW